MKRLLSMCKGSKRFASAATLHRLSYAHIQTHITCAFFSMKKSNQRPSNHPSTRKSDFPERTGVEGWKKKKTGQTFSKWAGKIDRRIHRVRIPRVTTFVLPLYRVFNNR